jgi:hypothetical protein
MRNHGVVVRFISLLDVTLVLVGVLLIVLTQTSEGRDDNPDTPITFGLEINVIYFYGDWEGDQKGKVYLLDESWKSVKEVDTNSPEDIDQVIKTRGLNVRSDNVLLILLTNRDGWYGKAFGKKHLEKIAEVWGEKKKLTPMEMDFSPEEGEQ